MIEWIVTSSLLILLVSALRLAVKGRVSPRLRYALWAVVLLRLLVPGQLIRLPAAMPAVPEVPQVAERLEQESIYVLPVQTTPVEDADLVTVRDGAVVEDASPFGYARLEDEGRTVVRYARRFSPIEILRAVWLTGTAAVAGFFLAVNLRFYLRLRRSRRPLPAYGGRLVYAVEGIVSPCLFGLLDPAIYLTPDCAESESARRHILAHELTHYRQGDHLWAILRGAALALHWYNPLVWWAAAMSRRDCELSCDAGAVRLLGGPAGGLRPHPGGPGDPPHPARRPDLLRHHHDRGQIGDQGAHRGAGEAAEDHGAHALRGGAGGSGGRGVLFRGGRKGRTCAGSGR